jgi:outer membrane receptor protein involved in Fe transport
VSLYASYSTSFLPQSGDQFSVLSSLSETLVPEKFENIELGAKWAITPGLFATAAVFQLDRSNSQAPDPANPGQIILTGETRVKGIELSLAGEVTRDLQLSLGYTMLDGEVRSTTSAAPAGRSLQQVPHRQASAWARYQVTDAFGVGLGLIHQSRQFTSISNAGRRSAVLRCERGGFPATQRREPAGRGLLPLFTQRQQHPAGRTDQRLTRRAGAVLTPSLSRHCAHPPKRDGGAFIPVGLAAPVPSPELPAQHRPGRCRVQERR